mmetsp:Transcript_88441/g.159465  ORF Transcript_88441/g.159465 Transcript_88441/m.159465 type:complete len:93 (+) Transcript_88441:297-575(+)
MLQVLLGCAAGDTRNIFIFRLAKGPFKAIHLDTSVENASKLQGGTLVGEDPIEELNVWLQGDVVYVKSDTQAWFPALNCAQSVPREGTRNLS